MYTIIAVLLCLWLVGVLSHVGGGLIHTLLLVCGVLFLIQMFSGRATV